MTTDQLYRQRNIERIRKRDRETKRKLNAENPEYMREVNQRYLARNRDAINARRRARRDKVRPVEAAWRKRNPDKVNAYNAAKLRRRRQRNVNFQLSDCLRNALKRALKRQRISKTNSIFDYLGCSIEDLKIYLKSKFDVGMSWDNYSHAGWHIDHIVPCSLFDLSKHDHRYRCFHFSNLQPLWSHDNLKKSAHSDGQFHLL